MGKQLECKLISMDTGKEYVFESCLKAERFLKHAGGYIRGCKTKNYAISHKVTGEKFDVVLGELKYVCTNKFSNPTICWDCQKASGRCSWSRKLEPVEGWDAKPTIIKYAGSREPSYIVRSCPEFVADAR